jgi:hypothetical protein
VRNIGFLQRDNLLRCQLHGNRCDRIIEVVELGGADKALEAASRILKELGVTINPQKTRIVHVRHGFEFLGYKIKRGSGPMNLPTSKIKTSARRGSLYAYPREKSINHFKEQIRRLTRRCAPVTTQELIQQVNPGARSEAGRQDRQDPGARRPTPGASCSNRSRPRHYVTCATGC